mmetsp:Transcript_44922/g.108596  ORF Transcript_44922/g.108596 Transcript_44922/m.108596 type:complete len:103 (-) Transcript_44922:38-346(-)
MHPSNRSWEAPAVDDNADKDFPPPPHTAIQQLILSDSSRLRFRSTSSFALSLRVSAEKALELIEAIRTVRDVECKGSELVAKQDPKFSRLFQREPVPFLTFP